MTLKRNRVRTLHRIKKFNLLEKLPRGHVVGIRINETSGEVMDPEKRCGSTLTYAYFVSFIFLCRSAYSLP